MSIIYGKAKAQVGNGDWIDGEFSPVISVKLEIIKDGDAGFTFFHFSWRDGDTLHSKIEIANRFLMYSYDPEIDGPIGEARRAALEFFLNSPQSSEVLKE